ncbi:MAG: hypothetical protein AAFV53_21645 [Myxococcota bacterium]
MSSPSDAHSDLNNSYVATEELFALLELAEGLNEKVDRQRRLDVLFVVAAAMVSLLGGTLSVSISGTFISIGLMCLIFALILAAYAYTMHRRDALTRRQLDRVLLLLDEVYSVKMSQLSMLRRAEVEIRMEAIAFGNASGKRAGPLL